MVANKLGLRDELELTLLHWVGGAGGLSIMRAGAQVASGATLLTDPLGMCPNMFEVLVVD